MFNGIALETKCSLRLKRNKVLGVCREHGHRVETELTSVEVIENIRKALVAPESDLMKVCFGSDATVVAIGPYARKDRYAPWPVVVSPSDKTEKGEELVKWIAEVLRCWKEHPYGDVLHGPIWTLASDGDSSYRLAKHIYCVLNGQEIDSSTNAGRTLRLLEGLNLFMSQDGVTAICDPKHIFKRASCSISLT